MRLFLDCDGDHWLECDRLADGRARLTLGHDRGDRRSPLHDALRRLVRIGGRSLDGDSIAVDGAGELEVRLGDGGPVAGRLAAGGGSASGGYRLSSFECRYLAEYGRLYPVPPGPVPAPALRTDLHSHFAGCVRARQLVALGAAHGVCYPAALLAEAGITVAGASELAALSRPIREALARRLEVPTERRITFLEMEQIYRLRSPLTKHPAMFVPLLRQIATDYAAMGIQYAELSMGEIVRADRLAAVHGALPAIEAETGVELRFLAAMSRHDDLEWDLDYLDRLRELAASRYLVGVDFMGHETNSTAAFARQLREVAGWASRCRPGFAVRVHAGENPAHPENVRLAVELVAGSDVMLRIGHGLYGVDPATLDRLAASSAVVEFNLNSNFALNNIQSVGEAPIRRYLRHGVAVVLGSDGYGIYRSSPQLEARAAWLCGVSDVAAIAACEDRYLAQRRARDAAAVDDDFAVPPDRPPVHYSGAVDQRRRRARQQRRQRLADRIADVGAALVDSADELVRGRRCLSIAGAWRASWERLSGDEREQISGELSRLIAGLDPDRDLLITGGTRFGVEGLVGERARRAGVRHLGLLVESTPPDALAPGLISHAAIAGESLHDKAACLYQLMRDACGLCLFVGGGNIVSDEIQTARNLRLRFRLMEGIAGASATHAAEQPERGFSHAGQVLALLADSVAAAVAGFRHIGVNPTADVVLVRRHPQRGDRELLLIRRDIDAAAEGGAWALPGGFVATAAAAGEAWTPGAESERDCAVRELYEETGLDLRRLAGSLRRIGQFQGSGRDPRDDQRAWSRSTAFLLELPPALADAPMAGGDDACDARWYPVDAFPPALAFDHAAIIAAALAALD